MKIEGKMTAGIQRTTVRKSDSADGREAEFEVAIIVKQEEAVEKWGEAFAALAFSSMRPMEGSGEDEGDSLSFLQDRIAPSKKKFVCPPHQIEIDGESFDAQPELTKIETVDGQPRVVAYLKIPFDPNRKKLKSVLDDAVRGLVEIKFTVKQASFEFKPKTAEAKVGIYSVTLTAKPHRTKAAIAAVKEQ